MTGVSSLVWGFYHALVRRDPPNGGLNGASDDVLPPDPPHCPQHPVDPEVGRHGQREEQARLLV
jgi:hypothetical protein